MKSLISYDHPGLSSDSRGDGGDVDDILNRLGRVEVDVSELKSKASAILATIPHLATKSDVAEVKSAVADLRAETSSEIGGLRTEMAEAYGALRTEMAQGFGALRSEIAGRETAFIKWMIATVLAVAGVAFTIAKFVH